MSEHDQKEEFYEFVDSVKSRIPIAELYTELTGETFEMVDARPRAHITWRDDKTPSLCLVSNKNILWDFTDKKPGSDKPGREYNVLDILQKVGGACSFSHALQMACDRLNIEIPQNFRKQKKEFGNIPINLGNKIIEVWEACKKNAELLVCDSSKRPLPMIKFFDDRNIPYDMDFIKSVNIGVCPQYSVVYDILKGTGILRKGNDDKELNIYREELGDNALVFPLYNLDGALCGLRFRQFDKKSFAEWKPLNNSCFFNANRFPRRPKNKRIIIVEGEMNLVAYARAVYDKLKKKEVEKIQEQLNIELSIIYSTGSKSNDINLFKGELTKVLYIQDHDVKDYDESLSPKDHPVLITCTKISNEIDADDLRVVDWGVLPYASEKYDIEAYLKYHNFNVESLRDLPIISLPRYALNTIKQYIGTIKDEDIQKENQIKYTFLIADKLQFAQRKVFEEIASKEFSLGNDIDNALSQERDIKCDEFSIDPLGRIIESVVTDNGPMIVPKTNFYMRISDEITYLNNYNNIPEKKYMVEIVINGRKIHKNEVQATDIVDPKKMLEFAASEATITDLLFYDSDLRGKKFSVITNIMSTIPIPKKTYIFSSIGRPFEEFCCSVFKTEKFCMFPKVSVMDGQIIENSTKGFDVFLGEKNAIVEKMPFGFTILDDDKFNEAGNLFWNHLRYIHDVNIIDSLISMVYDSCTRENQGYGIVQNQHGFPIYLAGQSGSYKTTSAIAAMSLLGGFKTQEDLLSWNGTALSVEHRLISIGTLTHTIDDLKIEHMKSNEFTNFFQGIYGGNTKTRMAQSGDKVKGGNKLKCSVIITSEGQVTDVPEAIAARMLVLRVVKCDKKTGKERKIHFDLMRKRLNEDGSCNFDLMAGFMPRLIAWTQNRGIKPYALSLAKWKAHYEKLLEKEDKNNSERPADMVTRLIGGFEQIVDFCIEKEFCSEKEGRERIDEFVKFWDKEIIVQVKRIERHSSTHKAIDLLCQIIFSNNVGMRYYDKNKWLDTANRKFNQPFQVCDVIYPDERGHKFLVVSINGLLRGINGITETTSIVTDKFETDLQESGIIEKADERYVIPSPRGSLLEDTAIPSHIIDHDKLINEYRKMKFND